MTPSRAAVRKLTMRDKGFWRRLTKAERFELVTLQMSRSTGYGGGGYLPEDCSECGACGLPMLGAGGMCSACYKRYARLMAKGSGTPERSGGATPCPFPRCNRGADHIGAHRV